MHIYARDGESIAHFTRHCKSRIISGIARGIADTRIVTAKRIRKQTGFASDCIFDLGFRIDELALQLCGRERRQISMRTRVRSENEAFFRQVLRLRPGHGR